MFWVFLSYKWELLGLVQLMVLCYFADANSSEQRFRLEASSFLQVDLPNAGVLTLSVSSFQVWQGIPRTQPGTRCLQGQLPAAPKTKVAHAWRDYLFVLFIKKLIICIQQNVLGRGHVLMRSITMDTVGSKEGEK